LLRRGPPLSRPRLTSWFDAGPAPGQPGPAALYGHVDTAAELRLISCGGAFDASAGSYLDNIVVYARLTAVTVP
jgi:hypothetical protein